MTKGFSIKSSRVLEKLRSGGIASCMKLNMADSRAFEIAAMTGFDCLWTDMEHVANDWSVIEKQILAAKAYRTDILVRVSRGSYSDYTRPLELDSCRQMEGDVLWKKVSWNKNSNLSNLSGRNLRICFDMFKADIYGFKFE